MKVKILLFCLLITHTLPLSANQSPANEANKGEAQQSIVTPNLSTIDMLAKEVISKKIAPKPNAKVTITPQNLEGRQQPPRCYEPISANLATDREISRTNTVKISCDSPDLAYPWQIYVAVRVAIEYPVVVAKEVLSPKTVLSSSQLTLAYMDQYSLRGEYYSSIDELVGTRVKRKTSQGSPLLKRSLCFVCKGDAISIWAKTDTLQIKTTGEAMRDGNIGDVIKVKNTNSNKQLDAQVIGIGEVEVKM
ncbi:flagellar basal body P-ring formation protein FlgA [Shewanella maritima]|uniref:Flagella basal body P-ring formation protein FlgA n=1 Tax=Shewanella maritima TaxID=2520507 RepID=A0A411PDZ0_9GAMM|nr:flagellar basal body P-ring formation chaperone FlgA [Shewanella maritima]QBF81769.1 flagellar basal body P-ring formation protein FlgA [Shewanella maritima]